MKVDFIMRNSGIFHHFNQLGFFTISFYQIPGKINQFLDQARGLHGTVYKVNYHSVCLLNQFSFLELINDCRFCQDLLICKGVGGMIWGW